MIWQPKKSQLWTDTCSAASGSQAPAHTYDKHRAWSAPLGFRTHRRQTTLLHLTQYRHIWQALGMPVVMRVHDHLLVENFAKPAQRVTEHVCERPPAQHRETRRGFERCDSVVVVCASILYSF